MSNEIKSLVIGNGSIGRRHAEVLKDIGAEVQIISRRATDVDLRSLSAALEKTSPDYIVIATETSDHTDQLNTLKAHGYSGLTLVEKPLCGDLSSFPKGLWPKVYVGYNLRFHPLVERLKSDIQDDTILQASFYVGQHLATWREGDDSKDRYSGSKAQGGGALRDLSHELDLMTFLLGTCANLRAIGGKYSDVTQDSDDIFSLLCQLEKSPVVTVNINYLDRLTQRHITLIGQKHTYFVDLIRQVYRKDGSPDRSTSVERNDTYIAMHENLLQEQDIKLCTWQEAKHIMGIIQAAEDSARTGGQAILLEK